MAAETSEADTPLRWGIPIAASALVYLALLPVAGVHIAQHWGSTPGHVGQMFGAFSHMVGLLLLLIGMWLWVPITLRLLKLALRVFTSMSNHPSYFVRRASGSAFLWIGGPGVLGLIFFVVMPAYEPVLGTLFADSLDFSFLGVEGQDMSLSALAPSPLRYLSLAVPILGYGTFLVLNRSALATRLG